MDATEAEKLTDATEAERCGQRATEAENIQT